MIFLTNGDAFAEGRLLRGERWQPFVLDDNETDFYVAPDGNDSWSGTISAPNRQKTDGPFATIGRAQQAVRETIVSHNFVADCGGRSISATNCEWMRRV